MKLGERFLQFVPEDDVWAYDTKNLTGGVFHRKIISIDGVRAAYERMKRECKLQRGTHWRFKLVMEELERED